MDRMYAPWRLAFLKGQVKETIPCPTGCIFCDYVVDARAGESQRERDQARLVITRRERAFVIVNKYPYTNGHVMVVPRVHTDKLEDLDEQTFLETQSLLRETIAAIRRTYQPHGLNVGMNMGEAAGAGIKEHIHWHALPRWKGDANFMPAIGDVRVISEAHEDTWARLAEILRKPSEG